MGGEPLYITTLRLAWSLMSFRTRLEDLYTLIKDYEVTTWDYNNFDIGEEEEEER